VNELIKTSQLSEMEKTLTNCLKHEQDLNATLNERIMELEQENKTLTLKLRCWEQTSDIREEKHKIMEDKCKTLKEKNAALHLKLNAIYAGEVDDG